MEKAKERREALSWEAKLSALSDALEEATAENGALATTKSALESSLAAEQARAADLERHVQALTDEQELTNEQLALTLAATVAETREGERRELEERQLNHDDEILGLTTALTNARVASEESAQRMASLNERLEAERARTHALEQDLERSEAARVRLQTEAGDLRQATRELQAGLEAAEAEAQSHARARARAQIDAKSPLSKQPPGVEVEQLRAALSESRAALEAAERRLKTDTADLRAELVSLRHELDDADDDRQAQRARIDSMAAARTVLQGQVSELRDDNASLTQQLHAMNGALERSASQGNELLRATNVRLEAQVEETQHELEECKAKPLVLEAELRRVQAELTETTTTLHSEYARANHLAALFFCPSPPPPPPPHSR